MFSGWPIVVCVAIGDSLSPVIRPQCPGCREPSLHPKGGGQSGETWFTVGRSGGERDWPQMLLGEHEHTIDDKNRLTLPARFRQAFAEGIVVTRGMDGCLFAYAREDWDHLVQGRLATLDPLS